MKLKIFLVLVYLSIISCQPSNTTHKYFTEKQADSLLINIITYTYQKAPQATNATRFNKEFRNFYAAQTKKFKIENISLLKDSTYVFFMTRPVGNKDQFRRGVIGKFKLKKGTTMPIEFEEIVNTPHLKEKDVLEKGNFLFKTYEKTQDLKKYLGMKHYIEWPDSTLVYDKNNFEWVHPKNLTK